MGSTRTFGITDSQLEGYIDQAREWLSSGNLTDTATAAGLTATHIVAGFFLAMFTLYFFLYDGPVIWGWVVRLFPRGAREKVHSSGLIAWDPAVGVHPGHAGRRGGGRRRHRRRARPSSACPSPPGIALLVFFGAFIPVVGAAISGTVAVLLALVALGPVQALIMLGIVIGVQQIEAHLLQPLLVGRVMRIHPLAVILAIAAGVVLAGIIGGLIAVPTVAVLNAVGPPPARLAPRPRTMSRRTGPHGRGRAHPRARRQTAEAEAERPARSARRRRPASASPDGAEPPTVQEPQRDGCVADLTVRGWPSGEVGGRLRRRRRAAGRRPCVADRLAGGRAPGRG